MSITIHHCLMKVIQRDPLARFGLTQRDSLLAALRAHDYVLPLALLYYAQKKEEIKSAAAATALLDVFEAQGSTHVMDFVRCVIDIEIERTPSERDLLRENNFNSRLLKVMISTYSISPFQRLCWLQ